MAKTRTIPRVAELGRSTTSAALMKAASGAPIAYRVGIKMTPLPSCARFRPARLAR